MGELQKRIIRLEMFDLSRNLKERDLVDAKEILKIVEEAKNEFPKFNSNGVLEYKRNGRIILDGNKSPKHIQKLRLTWFEKWFGGAEPQK